VGTDGLADRESVSGRGADRLQSMDRHILAGVTDTKHLHDPLARDVEQVDLIGGRWPYGQGFGCVPELVPEVLDGGLEGRQDKPFPVQAGVLADVHPEVRGADPYRYRVGPEHLASSDDIVSRFEAQSQSDVFVCGLLADEQHLPLRCESLLLGLAQIQRLRATCTRRGRECALDEYTGARFHGSGRSFVWCFAVTGFLHLRNTAG